MAKLLIIIPAYNEQENIERVVENLKSNFSQYDYIVVNDGSSDKTAEICLQKGYRLLNLPINLGLAGAVQAGMKYAYRQNYDAAIQFDADGQHRPEFIQPMLEELERGYDIVIGSRFVTEKKSKSMRMMGSRLIAFSIKITTGVTITDPTSGMRIYNRSMIRQFATQLNHAPEPDTISYLLSRKARISEVQVTMDERTAGVSYLNWTRSIGYMLRMGISILLMQWFRGKEPLLSIKKEEK